MGIVVDAADNAASSVKAATVVGTAAYSLTGWSYSDIAAVVSIVVSVVFLWGALPRAWRTTYALYLGLFKHDWNLWDALGDRPAKGD